MTAFTKSLTDVEKKCKHDHSSWLSTRFVEIKDKIQTDIQEAVEVLSQQINSWASAPYLEIEARLGYFTLEDDGSLNQPFDSDIGQEWFRKIYTALESGGFSRENTVSTDYFLGSMRMSVSSDGSRSAIRKKTMEHSNFTYENSPFDIRISFSQEEPINVKEFNKASKNQNPTIRKKTRTTFQTNHWKYDLTRVESENNGVVEARHEVEIEAKLDSIEYHDYVYMADSLMLKIRQLVNYCEEPEDTRNMIFLEDISKKYLDISAVTNGLKKVSLNK